MVPQCAETPDVMGFSDVDGLIEGPLVLVDKDIVKILRL